MIKILLDNGHGKDTPGKRSPVWPDGSQLLEWQFNRDIVARTATMLREAGIPVECLVSESHDIPLAERCRRANAFASRGDCLLISIHANAGGGSGGEIFSYPGAQQSRRYAGIFGDTWGEHLPEFRFRGCKEANFAILRDTLCPAILTETLFMDNPDDCKFLLSDTGRERIARWHAASIKNILK